MTEIIAGLVLSGTFSLGFLLGRSYMRDKMEKESLLRQVETLRLQIISRADERVYEDSTESLASHPDPKQP